MYTQDNNSLPVWIILSPAHHHISINSQPFLVGIVSRVVKNTASLDTVGAAASSQDIYCHQCIPFLLPFHIFYILGTLGMPVLCAFVQWLIPLVAWLASPFSSFIVVAQL